MARHAGRAATPTIETILGYRGRPSLELAVREGLPVGAFDRVAQALALKVTELARLIGIAPRTLTRRKRDKALSTIESDRLVAVARIAAHAEETFGSRERAQRWLRDPILVLGNERPIDCLDTEPGRRRVENVLYQIDYGMY